MTKQVNAACLNYLAEKISSKRYLHFVELATKMYVSCRYMTRYYHYLADKDIIFTHAALAMSGY